MATAKYFNPTTNQWEELNTSRLETPRNINGVPFDGSQDITIPTGDGGTSNYADLTNKPQINGVELSGNKTSANLGLQPAGNYLITETDPTVSAWAKTPNKPSYTASEVGALPNTTTLTNIDGYPLTPTFNKFLRDDKTFSEIIAGSGGYAANVYLTNIDSDIATYKKISYTLEPSETIVDTSSTNATTLIKSYLYDSGVGISILDAGAWTFSITCKLSSLNGVNSIKAEVYKKTIASGEVILFNAVSNNITNTDYQRLKFETNFGSISVEPTDRIGVKLYFTTTSLIPIILSVKAGSTDASYFNTPIALRHNQLRGLNDDVNVQHLTNAEKTQGALATGVTAIPTVKQTADLVLSNYTNLGIFNLLKESDNNKYYFFKKYNLNKFAITSHDTYNHCSYIFEKDTNDDFVKMTAVGYGTLFTYNRNVYNSGSSDRTGVWNGTTGNIYTTEIGATFKAVVVGQQLLIRAYNDNRGGLWELTIDGDSNNKIYYSCFATNASISDVIVTRYLKLGSHTVMGKFLGSDPNNAPVGGIARGWLYYDNTQTNYGSITGLTYNADNMSTQVLYGLSNKEVALQLVVGSESNLFPDHGVGTAFYATPKKLYLDGVDIEFANIPALVNVDFSVCRVVQDMYYRLPLAGNVARVVCTHEFTGGVFKFKNNIRFLQGGILNILYPLMIPANGIGGKFISSLKSSKTGVGDSTTIYYDKEAAVSSEWAYLHPSSSDYAILAKFAQTSNIIDKSNYKQYIWDRTSTCKLYFNTYNTPKPIIAGTSIATYSEMVLVNVSNASDVLSF